MDVVAGVWTAAAQAQQQRLQQMQQQAARAEQLTAAMSAAIGTTTANTQTTLSIWTTTHINVVALTFWLSERLPSS